MPTGTIALNPTPAAALGETVTFTWTADGLHGHERARIQILAYQDTDADGQVDDLVYAWADWAEAGFLLGAGASEWLSRGGPAHCVATVGFFDNHDHWNELATTEFDAGG